MPSTWLGIEPATLGIEGQRYTNLPTRSTNNYERVLLNRVFSMGSQQQLHKGDNAGEMSLGSSTESYPAFACIGLRENPGKNLNQVTCPDRDSNPGYLVSRPDVLTVTPQDAGANAKPTRIIGSTAGYESIHTAAAQSRLGGGTAAFYLQFTASSVFPHPAFILAMATEQLIEVSATSFPSNLPGFIVICCLVNCLKTGLDPTSDTNKTTHEATKLGDNGDWVYVSLSCAVLCCLIGALCHGDHITKCGQNGVTEDLWGSLRKGSDISDVIRTVSRLWGNGPGSRRKKRRLYYLGHVVRMKRREFPRKPLINTQKVGGNKSDSGRGLLN
ncbi:hypothetical protein ANN_20486 [Periplaneta americana]|uniref:Uncharacterized protein n=1 Tax=Periplaneta americana TaxID=6978 RepID=A0ABQ8SDX0_PERAM|nr:hypothetical protein ANN_20486 [Periplaneta americana]